MIIQTWGELITASLQSLWVDYAKFLLTNFLGAVIVFVIGWIIASILGRITAQIVRVLRIDSALEKIGFKETLAKADLELDSGRFVGELVKWFFIIAFLMATTEILNLSEVTVFLRNVLLYIPKLIVAVLILLAAVLLANLLQRLVRASVDAAGLRGGRILGAITKWVILIFAVLAALLQLGIVPSLIQTLFTGLIAALSLGLGLAFGLGGKDVAAQMLGNLRKEVAEKK